MRRVLIGLAAATAVGLGVSPPASADPTNQVFTLVCQNPDGSRFGTTMHWQPAAGHHCASLGARAFRVIPWP